jgi:hypothetical protein
MSEINKQVLEDDEAYLIIPEEHVKKIAMPETVWAKIDDDGKLEVLRWDIIEMYSAEFDSLIRNGKEKSQTHVICKLLVLVREQVKRDLVLSKQENV